MRRSGTAFALCFVVLMASAAVALADANADSAAATLEKNSPAVVRVMATLNIQAAFGGSGTHKEEKRQEITGTVLDASGLTVVSLLVLDPSDMMKEVMERAPTRNKASYQIDVSDLKICTADGKEIPARLIFKEPDLDLAFLLPTSTAGEAAPAFAAVPATAAPEVKILDNLLTITRLNKALHRTPAAKLFEVTAIVRKPHTAYICANEGRTPSEADPTILLGAPVFTADGGFAGIWTMSKNALLTATGRGRMAEPEPVVLPAEAVLGAAKQARAAKDQPVAQTAAATSGTTPTQTK